LKEYYGDADDAFELAKRNDDQYGVAAILGHRGDPVAHRKYTTFLLRFDDGDLSAPSAMISMRAFCPICPIPISVDDQVLKQLCSTVAFSTSSAPMFGMVSTAPIPLKVLNFSKSALVALDSTV